MSTKVFLRFDLNEKSLSYTFSPSETAKRVFAYRDTCGHFVTTSEYYQERESYNAVLIIYLLSGSFFYCSDNEIIRVSPGELAVFDTFDPHIYGTDVESDFIWLHISGNGIRELINELIMTNDGYIFTGTKTIQIRNFLFHMIDICSEKLEVTESEISLLIYKNLYSLIPNVNIKKETFTSRIGGEYIIKSLEFIRNNYGRKITVKDIADNVYLSEAHFSRLFKLSMDVSPYSYLKEYRIDMAIHLLHQGVSINEAAAQTGWNSTSNFIYTFKKSTGVSPGKYINLKKSDTVRHLK
jgi:AraC-type DNA-binding domain-containing proteins